VKRIRITALNRLGVGAIHRIEEVHVCQVLVGPFRIRTRQGLPHGNKAGRQITQASSTFTLIGAVVPCSANG
jgi:hypothetical protein